MLDVFTKFCLKFTGIYLILPIVVIGMIFHRRDMYAKAICFLFWVVIANTLLKFLFNPMVSHLGVGYIFPSGHMHAAAAFYGFIFYKVDNKLVKVLISALIVFIGFSLVHFNFHNWIDVIGAVTFACVEIFLYHVLSKNFGDKTVGAIAIFSSIVMMIFLKMSYKIEYHIWLAFYSMLGMEFSLLLFDDVKLNTIFKKLEALFLSVLGIGVIYFLFNYFKLSFFYVSEIKFALFPIIIIGSINISKYVSFNKSA